MVQYSRSFVLLMLLPLVAFPFVVNKLWKCPKCNGTISWHDESYSYDGFPSKCRHCGASLEPYDKEECPNSD